MGEESRSRQTEPLIGYFRHRRRLVATNQRVRRNLPRFPDLVNHLDRERAPTRKNLGRTRVRAPDVLPARSGYGRARRRRTDVAILL
jgi:hypothetical protein